MASRGMEILLSARTLIGTPYSRLDCSHFVHKAYQMAGLDYPYTSTDFFSSLTKYFTEVKSPDSGDVVLYKGHMGLYDPAGCVAAETAECKKLGNNAPILSARSGKDLGVEFGRSNWFTGTPKYFRWKSLAT